MMLWGAIWGAVLGALWPGYNEFGWLCGLILGGLAGLSLRKVIRDEIAQAQQASIASTSQIEAYAPSPLKKTDEATDDTPVVASAENGWYEEDVSTLEPQQSIPVFSPSVAAPVSATELPQAEASLPFEQAQQLTSDPIFKLFGYAKSWLLGGNTVVRLGVVVLFIGLSFLVKYAAEHAMLPVELRLAAVGAMGIALLVTGFRLRIPKPEYAMTLQGAGVAVMYLTIFAAFRLYTLIPAGMAFLLMGLVCALSTVIALLQNSRTLAVIGFAGGFLAPVLTSTGQGSHVGLFTYYAMLNLAILYIALKRAWRVLNLVGFFATFGIASAWGVLKYTPENYASIQPFLIFFFLLYVTTAILYAKQQATKLKDIVDGTLVFGTPLLGFGLQAGLIKHVEFGMAFSALAVAAFYLLLALWLVKQARLQYGLLIECFLALSGGFATLAVPLALDAHWTATVWAVEGAGVFWMGMRQQRWMARASGLALQAIAALVMMAALDRQPMAMLSFANPEFIGAMLLALPAFAIAWWTRQPIPHSDSAFARVFVQIESALSTPIYLYGFLWWLIAFVFEIDRVLPDEHGNFVSVIRPDLQANFGMLLFTLSAFLSLRLGLKQAWKVAKLPAYVVMPVMLFFEMVNLGNNTHLFQAWGWLIWPVGLACHFAMLRKIDADHARQWFGWVHTLGVWLIVILLANGLLYLIGKAYLWRTAWASVALMVAATLVLLGLAVIPVSKQLMLRWPMQRFVSSYLWQAALPLVCIMWLGVVIVAMSSNGNTAPLPYIPLLNPVEISIGLALATLVLWWMRLKTIEISLPDWTLGKAPKIAIALASFITINTVWLRIVHHFNGVAWDAQQLFDSALVQAGYAILWTLLALVLMITANRRHVRQLWIAGAGLLGLTVAKLLLIDLSNVGGVERIIAFIGVGVLMLVVGYFAPLPAKDSVAEVSGAS